VRRALYLADVRAARAMVVWVGAIDSRVKCLVFVGGVRNGARCMRSVRRLTNGTTSARARRHRVRHAPEGESELVAREEILGGRQGLWPLARRG
jgi:hypothetical protein